jgi:hypothetical protein
MFHELSSDGTPNLQGLVFNSFDDKIGPLTLNVDHDHLQGLRMMEGHVVEILEGDALIGAQISIYQALSPPTPAPEWVLRISGYDYTVSWIEGDSKLVPVYFFEYYSRADGPNKTSQLCEPSDEPLSGNYKGMAVIYRGERYDAAKKTVTDLGSATPWFNIGCEKTAVAKMHLLRHTLAASEGIYAPTWDQRQAVLKMLTADFCGGGKSFTVNGHPLHYEWTQKWQPHIMPSSADSPEAIWTSGGAVCLSNARDPDLWPGVPPTCRLRPCDTPPTNWPSSGYILSTNPPAIADMAM